MQRSNVPDLRVPDVTWVWGRVISARQTTQILEYSLQDEATGFEMCRPEGNREVTSHKDRFRKVASRRDVAFLI